MPASQPWLLHEGIEEKLKRERRNAEISRRQKNASSDFFAFLCVCVWPQQSGTVFICEVCMRINPSSLFKEGAKKYGNLICSWNFCVASFGFI